MNIPGPGAIAGPIIAALHRVLTTVHAETGAAVNSVDALYELAAAVNRIAAALEANWSLTDPG